MFLRSLIFLVLVSVSFSLEKNKKSGWESIKLNPIDVAVGKTYVATGPVTIFDTVELSKLVQKLELMKLDIEHLSRKLDLAKQEAETQRVSKVNIKQFMELQAEELKKVIQIQKDLIETIRKELESSGKRGKTRGLFRKLGQVLSTYGYYKALDDLTD